MRTGFRKRIFAALAMGLAVLLTRVAYAGDPLGFRDLEPASDQEINGMRGGYVTEGGLNFSFGVEQAIYVNGVLKATNTLNIAKEGPGLPQAIPGTAGNTPTVVQIGPGNTFLPADLDQLQSGFFTVVQNSMDQQVIQNINKINATISVLGLQREINRTGTMSQQLIQTLR